MATANVTKAQTARPAKAEAAVEVSPPSRREFLYYIWGASIALLLGEATAGIIWFALPRFKPGEFGGTFTYQGDNIPTETEPPLNIPVGRFWLSTGPGEGFVALYGVCT